MKKILIVDDSALMRRVLCDIIKADDRFEVGDVARTGREAYDFLRQKEYDGMVLDIVMPDMNGLQLLELLQTEKKDIPTIIVSTLAYDGAVETEKALELGAFDFVQKPDNLIEAKGGIFHERLLSTLIFATNNFRRRPMSGESMSKKDSGKNQSGNTKSLESGRMEAAAAFAPVITKKNNASLARGNKLIALACSTGGPKSLQSVIPYLPENLDAPMVLVQHMPAGFTKALADRLNEASKVTVKEAEEGEPLRKGWVYIAPGGKHLEVAKVGKEHRVHISDAPPIGGLRPCANVMYRSLIHADYDEIVCVVLTGMGGDGTDGITQLSMKKKIYVIAQDQKTSVVYGMPKTIAQAGLVDLVEPLDRVADAITKNVGVH
jgi:two-component system chemotaxis response regulator CheB